MDQVYKLYTDEQISSEGFGKRYRPVEDQHEKLLKELPTIQADLDLDRMNALSRDAIAAEADSLYGNWASLDQEEKRSIVESIVENIEVGDGEIAITLSCRAGSASSKEMTKQQRTL